MSDNFLENISIAAPLKDFIENNSRLEHGKRMIISDPKLASRNVTLTFTINGKTPEEYLDHYRAFVAELHKGNVALRVPALGETYKLVYLNSASYALDGSRTVSKLACKFVEPNPQDRT
ncbi:hypothetical protein [Parabacteroides distasonis]|uniref:hypothetical protein n=1 Tax=Parabacteroides distasonis TaxID=823 RepID=UPI0022DECA3B|nr:hypothetical protein [Parabacteroides distasonis]